MSYQTRRLDHLGIVAGMCERIGLVEQIDTLILDVASKEQECDKYKGAK